MVSGAWAQAKIHPVTSGDGRSSEVLTGSEKAPSPGRVWDRQAGPGRCRGDGQRAASLPHAPPEPGPVLSRASTRRGLYPGEASEVRKDEIFGELSRVPENQRRLLQCHHGQSPGSRGLQEDSGPGVLETQPGQRRLKGAQQVRRRARPPPEANPHPGDTLRDPRLPPVPPTLRQGRAGAVDASNT